MPKNGNSTTHVVTVDTTELREKRHFVYRDESGHNARRLKVTTGQKVAWQLQNPSVADPSKVHLFILFPGPNGPFNGKRAFHTTAAKPGERQPTTPASRVRRVSKPVKFAYSVAVIDENNAAKPITHAEDPIIEHSGTGG